MAVANFFSRFYMAILGLAIAVGLTVSLFSISDGLTARTQKSLENRQIDLYVLPKQTEVTPFFDEFGNPSAAIPFDLISVIGHKPNVTAAAPVIPLTVKNKGEWLHLVGISPDKFSLFYPSPFRIQHGALMEPRTESALLGPQLADHLNVNVGYMVTAGDRDLSISGILSKTGTFEDDQGFIPLQEAMSLTRKRGYPELYVQLNSETLIEETQKEIVEDNPDLSAYTSREYFAPTFYFLQRLKMIEWTIAAAALLLTLILQSGIFLSATGNRKKEIAIFQAFGASRPLVFYWMVQDGLLVFIIGTLGGLILGSAGGMLMNEIIVSLFHLSFPVSGFSRALFGMSAGISFIITVLSLVAPAFIVANLNLFRELEKPLCD